METGNFWWLKGSKTADEPAATDVTSTFKQNEDPSTISSSLREFLEKERALESPEEADTDIGSIIEEINKLAAESPLGPYDKDEGDRSFEEIMKEAEKIYIESSKSFEHFTGVSRTSANVSTPTPKSASPLPLDDDKDEEEYSDDFTDKSEAQTPNANENIIEDTNNNNDNVKKLESENAALAETIKNLKVQLEENKLALDKTKSSNFEVLKTPETKPDLEKALEELKDTKETNTALQLQLDNLNKTHLQLKSTYEEISTANNNLEKRILETESVLSKCAQEIQLLKEHRDKLLENETNLANLLEIEKLQVKNLKSQNDKDARCILDLNRQVKEMERIIARKHPDSVSALIVAAKNDHSENNLSARKVLEDRIRSLETEVVMRDQQSSKVFLEVQEKFTEMKNKYESHIEDLELHVNDLKNQIKKKSDTYDVYTQTVFEHQNPVKETKECGTQSIQNKVQPQKLQSAKKVEKIECKDDTRLLTTIRGLQADLVNKEKVIVKMQKEMDEGKKTNRRLQKEREGSLRNIAERREFRSYPEKLTLQLKSSSDSVNFEEELKALRTERDKMKVQLCRMEEDYQNLKSKRLFDLSALQEAHETEIATYVANITPLREQLQCHQKTIASLQEQLQVAKEQISVLHEERKNLMKRMGGGDMLLMDDENSSNKKIVVGRADDEHEYRLKAILQRLVQNQESNRGCQQCFARQQQLIFYKTKLDELLATVQTLA